MKKGFYCVVKRAAMAQMKMKGYVPGVSLRVFKNPESTEPVGKIDKHSSTHKTHKIVYPYQLYINFSPPTHTQ